MVERYSQDPLSLLWHLELSNPSVGSIVIRDIWKVLINDDLISAGFKENLLVVVGDGKKTKFWKDPWVTDSALCNVFPRLYALSENKEARIADVGSFSRGSWDWSLIFRRSFFTWEEELYSQLLVSINSIIPASLGGRLPDMVS